MHTILCISKKPAVSRAAHAALLAAAALLGSLPMRGLNAAEPPTVDAALKALVGGEQRTEDNRARDVWRHPYETLIFFGLRADQRVVEIWPGPKGWWTEILAPYLKEHGQYIAALPEVSRNPAYYQPGNDAFRTKVAGQPQQYARVQVVTFPSSGEFVPAASVDAILTFRNLHNWIADKQAEQAFAAFYKALKPGGVLGIEDHRAKAEGPVDPNSGYVREQDAIALAERAGFKLVARSEVNANPKDTKDYAQGVWTLPPTYRLKDQDRDRYAAIGESDRFTLKFVKP